MDIPTQSTDNNSLVQKNENPYKRSDWDNFPKKLLCNPNYNGYRAIVDSVISTKSIANCIFLMELFQKDFLFAINIELRQLYDIVMKFDDVAEINQILYEDHINSIKDDRLRIKSKLRIIMRKWLEYSPLFVIENLKNLSEYHKISMRDIVSLIIESLSITKEYLDEEILQWNNKQNISENDLKTLENRPTSMTNNNNHNDKSMNQRKEVTFSPFLSYRSIMNALLVYMMEQKEYYPCYKIFNPLIASGESCISCYVVFM
jgi:hypothetical protein